MTGKTPENPKSENMSRREFVGLGATAAALALIPGLFGCKKTATETEPTTDPQTTETTTTPEPTEPKSEEQLAWESRFIPENAFTLDEGLDRIRNLSEADVQKLLDDGDLDTIAAHLATLLVYAAERQGSIMSNSNCPPAEAYGANPIFVNVKDNDGNVNKTEDLNNLRVGKKLFGALQGLYEGLPFVCAKDTSEVNENPSAPLDKEMAMKVLLLAFGSGGGSVDTELTMGYSKKRIEQSNTISVTNVEEEANMTRVVRRGTIVWRNGKTYDCAEVEITDYSEQGMHATNTETPGVRQYLYVFVPLKDPVLLENISINRPSTYPPEYSSMRYNEQGTPVTADDGSQIHIPIPAGISGGSYNQSNIAWQ